MQTAFDISDRHGSCSYSCAPRSLPWEAANDGEQANVQMITHFLFKPMPEGCCFWQIKGGRSPTMKTLVNQCRSRGCRFRHSDSECSRETLYIMYPTLIAKISLKENLTLDALNPSSVQCILRGAMSFSVILGLFLRRRLVVPDVGSAR